MRALAALSAILLLSACAADKTSHFVAGSLASDFVERQTGSPWAGCAAAVGIGILKEAYDSTGRGNVETLDAVVTGAGCMGTIRF